MLHIAIMDDEGKIRRKITADCFIGAYHRIDGKDDKDGGTLTYVNCEIGTVVECLGEALKATERLEKKLWDAI